MNRHEQSLFELPEQLLVGQWKRVASIFEELPPVVLPDRPDLIFDLDAAPDYTAERGCSSYAAAKAENVLRGGENGVSLFSVEHRIVV